MAAVTQLLTIICWPSKTGNFGQYLHKFTVCLVTIGTIHYISQQPRDRRLASAQTKAVRRYSEDSATFLSGTGLEFFYSLVIAVAHRCRPARRLKSNFNDFSPQMIEYKLTGPGRLASPVNKLVVSF